MSDSFFENADLILASKRSARKNNVRYGRWIDHGCFYPATPANAAIRSAQNVPLPFDEAAWEKISLELHSRIPAEEKSVPPKKPNSLTTVNFNRN